MRFCARLFFGEVDNASFFASSTYVFVVPVFRCFTDNVSANTPFFAFDPSTVLVRKNAIFRPLGFKPRKGRQFPKDALPAKTQFLGVSQDVFFAGKFAEGFRGQICRGLDRPQTNVRPWAHLSLAFLMDLVSKLPPPRQPTPNLLVTK